MSTGILTHALGLPPDTPVDQPATTNLLLVRAGRAP
jgi:hypothetical protein